MEETFEKEIVGNTQLLKFLHVKEDVMYQGHIPGKDL